MHLARKIMTALLFVFVGLGLCENFFTEQGLVQVAQFAALSRKAVEHGFARFLIALALFWNLIPMGRD